MFENTDNQCKNQLKNQNSSESVRGVSTLPVRKDTVFSRETSGDFNLFSVLKMDKGYFKIWRKIRNHPVWADPNCLLTFLYCLNHAEWDSSRKIIISGNERFLQAGQFSCGRKQLAKEMNMSEQNVRTALKRLSCTYKILTIESTTKFSVITIVNWDRYQNGEKKSTNEVTNDQPTTNQRLTTQEELKHLTSNNKTISFDFESVWLKYPKRVGKKMAQVHFEASVKTQKDFEDLSLALSNYLSSKRVANGFVQNGSTFFNNWRDWIDYKEEVCKKCKDKGSFTSATGYAIICDCPAGKRK